MNKMIERDEKQYIEIENFKDYELTNCIAFEMAIRNKEALRLSIDITLLNFYSVSEHINMFIDNFESIENINKVTGISLDTLKIIKKNCTTKGTCKILDKDDDIDKLYDIMDNNKCQDSLNWIERKSDNYDFTLVIKELQIKLKNKFYIIAPFIDNLLETYNFSELKYTQMHKFISFDKSNDINSFFTTLNSIDLGLKIRDGIFILSETNIENNDIKQEYECFFDTREIDKNKMENHLNEKTLKVTHNIKPYLSRPILEVPAQIDKNVTLHDINLSLPTEELNKYILHIQKLFLKDHTIITTPLEILGEKVTYSNSTIKRDKTKTMQEKFADMLYIYDAIKTGMKKNIIQRSIVNYYSEKYLDKFTPNMDYSTINKYNMIAIDYIENLKYKELISATPIKN